MRLRFHRGLISGLLEWSTAKDKGPAKNVLKRPKLNHVCTNGRQFNIFQWFAFWSFNKEKWCTLSVSATAHAVNTLIQEIKHALIEPPAPPPFISTKPLLISCSKYPTASHGSVEPLQLFCCMMRVVKSINDLHSLSASCNKKSESGSLFFIGSNPLTWMGRRFGSHHTWHIFYPRYSSC